MGLAVGGETVQVDEQHAELALLAAQVVLMVHRPAGHVTADVTSEQVVEHGSFLKALGHRVEAGRQASQVAAVVEGYPHIEVALAHLAHRVAHPLDAPTSGGSGPPHHCSARSQPDAEQRRQPPVRHRTAGRGRE